MGWRARQPCQGGGAIRHMGDALRFGAVAGGGEGEVVVARLRILERQRARKDPAVQFRQHDVHGEVGGGETARACRPGGVRGGGGDCLEHRRAAGREQVLRLPRRKRGGGDDDIRPVRGDGLAHEGAGNVVFQGRHEKRQRCDPARGQRIAEGVNGRGISGEPHGAVEEDEDA